MYYCGLNECDTTNGPGIRVSLFVSGCTLHCKGCFNKESWDFMYGKEFTEATMNRLFIMLDNPYIEGLSILGGDPFESKNIETVYDIVRKCKKALPDKSIWIWTGRKKEHLTKDIEQKVLDLIDVLIDGPYVERFAVNPAEHKWYGSSNQRIIKLH